MPDTEVPDEWWFVDVDDRLGYHKQIDREREIDERVFAHEVDRTAAEWLREIRARQLAGDDRFAADPRCGNPNGCDNPPKPRGERCAACYEHRRRHGGEERPTRLINRGARGSWRR